MTKNLKTEIAQNSAAAPDEQKSPYGGGVEATAENHSESESLAPVQPRAPPTRMLRMREVMARTGLSRTTIWRRVGAGTFPAPRQLGPNSVGWPEPVIQDHIEALPTVSYAPSPETIPA